MNNELTKQFLETSERLATAAQALEAAGNSDVVDQLARCSQNEIIGREARVRLVD